MGDSSSTAAFEGRETIADVVQTRQRRIIEHPVYTAPFHIAKLKPSCFIDPITRHWIRNAADERAAQEGAFFSNERADFTIDWIEYNCIVYEGHLANTPFYLDDWAYECCSQVFGWMIYDDEWNECIRRFRRVSGWVPKKNGKSPTLAAIGTYMWAGDGEEGQKCYSAAKDGSMATIAHMHAVQFVKKNERLGRLCKIDNSNFSMTYIPTNSTYTVLYTGQSPKADKKEGLNGSSFVDETHVVSPELISVIERAGISRKEPLHAELSTTGYNIEGYGYNQDQAGILNLQNADKGAVYNSRLYYFHFGIPQATPLEDVRNPDKIVELIRISNPSLGRLVRRNEIMADWATSCQSDTELYKFMMYRLNMWHRSGQGAIALSDWLKCGDAVRAQISKLKQYPCVIGLDISRNKDMTAPFLMFSVPTPVSELPIAPMLGKFVDVGKLTVDDYEELFQPTSTVNIPHVIPYFFLPEATINLYSSFVDLREIAADPDSNLRMVPGLTIRPETVAAFINQVAESVDDFRVVASDPWRFKHVKRCLRTEYGWTDDNLIDIKQTWENMAPAYETLERLVLSKEIWHPNNRVLDWQLSNINLKEDENGNRRVIKPKYGDYRKIDGIVAMLNGLTYMCNDDELAPGSEALFANINEEDDDD